MTLRARGVVAGYAERLVLRGVDVALRAGELVAIVGPNGAGKSTLVRVLAGLLAPREGEVVLEGRPLAGLSRREVARRIAVVPQVLELLLPFTVEEVVGLGRTPYLPTFGGPSATDRAAVADAIDALELRALASRRIDTLSGGERQRAVLAMAIAQRTPVLLLDEPTVHLDPAHQRATLSLVRSLAASRGIAAAAVLHDLNLAAAMCDRIVALDGGLVAVEGAPSEVLRQATVDRIFGPGLRVLDGLIPPAVVPRP
ncbi:MAG TPA: ABC transporter ATP-binding protein [Candidatus Limnocylindria bacterium]|nr:ABC transporter ATP-binding protein [Candidatus Limnocylindria bacterium]